MQTGKFKIKIKNECDKTMIYLFFKTNLQIKNLLEKKCTCILKQCKKKRHGTIHIYFHKKNTKQWQVKDQTLKKNRNMIRCHGGHTSCVLFFAIENNGQIHRYLGD